MNKRKLGAIIVLLVASIAPAMILGGYVANALEPPHHWLMEESLALRNQHISENPASLNVSISVLNCGGKAISINGIKLDQIAQSSSPGVAVCVNGTYVDTASPLFVIQPNDTAIVNMIVPYRSFPYALSMLHSAKVVSVTVFTDEARYYVECSSNGGVSG